MILVLGKQRREDLFEFEASLGYRVGSTAARATAEKPSLKKNKAAESHLEPTFPSVPVCFHLL